jgi:hypothetical protein
LVGTKGAQGHAEKTKNACDLSSKLHEKP